MCPDYSSNVLGSPCMVFGPFRIVARHFNVVRLVMLVGFTMATASYSAAMFLQSEDGFAPMINFFLLPIQCLRALRCRLHFAPNWLQKIAFFNPFAHAVSAARHCLWAIVIMRHWLVDLQRCCVLHLLPFFLHHGCLVKALSN